MTGILRLNAKVDDRVSLCLEQSDTEIEILENGYIPSDVQLGRYGNLAVAINFETGQIENWDEIRRSIENWIDAQECEE